MVNISRKDLIILSHLRNNARETLTRISRRTAIPVSTIFDKLKQYEGNLITKYATLINFSQLGFNTRANVMIRVNRDSRVAVREYLSKHHNINSVYKINNGFDYMFEAVFVNIKDLEDFIEVLDQKFNILDRWVYYVVDDIKKEGFIENPELVDIIKKC